MERDKKQEACQMDSLELLKRGLEVVEVPIQTERSSIWRTKNRRFGIPRSSSQIECSGLPPCSCRRCKDSPRS